MSFFREGCSTLAKTCFSSSTNSIRIFTDGAQLSSRNSNKKKEVRGKKPQQEVDLGSKSAAAASGELCGSSGILNMWVNEVEKDGEKRLRGETGGVKLGEEPEQEPEAAGAEVNWRVSLFHKILKFLRRFFRQIITRG